MSQNSIKENNSLKIIREELQDKKMSIKDTNKGLRLTNIQKSQIEIAFTVFVKNLNKIEQTLFERHDELYVFTDEYQLYSYIMDFLYEKPYSVFACFQCRELVKMQQQTDSFIKKEKTLLHRCSEHKFGEGVQTNWKSLYYLFYESHVIRKSIITFFEQRGNSNE